MNLSELVQVYGKDEASTSQNGASTSQDSSSGKKATAKRTSHHQRSSKHAPRGGNRTQMPSYPPPLVMPPMPGYIPYDPTYGPQYGPPMYYGPVMMMMPPGYPPQGPHFAAPPMVPFCATNSGMFPNSLDSSSSNISDPSSAATSSSNSTEAGTSSAATQTVSGAVSSSNTSGPSTPTHSTNMAPTQLSYQPSSAAPPMTMSFTPNFVPAPSPYAMYPYEPSYLYGYAPPQKRAKRANHTSPSGSHTTTRKESPQRPKSPGSDSGASESSSSNTSSAPSTPSGATEKSSTKPKKFHCEPCEKSFKTQLQYEAHLTTHVPCPYDGCTYSAVRASLKLHELLHVNNMFAKLSTPEDIAKYREERKKRFPTLARAKAAAATAASSSSSSATNTTTDQDTSVDDGEPRASSSKGTEPPSDPLLPADAQAQTASRTKRKRAVCKYWKQGNCNKGDNCAYSHAVEMEPKSKRPKNTEAPNTGRHRSSVPSKDASAGKNLLSRFLESEISKENKIILQCLRYIVSNNFLQPSPPTSGSSGLS